MNQEQPHNQTPLFDKKHAFIVGIDDYSIVSPLETAINDAEELASVLENQYDYTIHNCLNPNGKILRGYLENMKHLVEENDCVVFYFAGHGMASDSDKGMAGFICPTDADKNKEETLVPMTFLNDCIAQLKCRHLLLILDCCFAGAFRWAEKYRLIGHATDFFFQQHYRYYITQSSRQVLTSTSHTQKALDSLGNQPKQDKPHSPFAQCLIDGLKGSARNEDTIITTAGLFNYLQRRIPVLTGEYSKSQNVGLFPLEKHGNGEFMFLPKGFEPEKIQARHYENPYMGLKAYTYDPDETKDESLMFFGREKAIKELVEMMDDHSFVVVVGASGTGKSSLVKAGVWRNLAEKGQKIAAMRPNKDPFIELTNLGNEFNILIIDQFEELITQSDTESASNFMNILRGYIQTGEKKIILTIRIDFESQIDKTGIEKPWQTGRFLIPPFTPEELRQIIITPAARVGRFFEPIELVDDIISEVVHYPGSLPLLSFTMSELFNRCEVDLYRNIGREDYIALGGVTGSLQKSADRIVEELSADEIITLKNILLRMVSLTGGEITGKRVFVNDVVFVESNNKKRLCVTGIIEKLVASRLIVTDVSKNKTEKYIEPAHDALVKAWGILHTWIKEFGEENIYLLNKLGSAIADYNAKGDTYLWDTNPNLKQVLALQNTEGVLFNGSELAFTNQSHKKAEKDMAALKQERDTARKETRAANNTSLALRTVKMNQTLALRIADYNVKQHTKNAVAAAVFHDILSDNEDSYYKIVVNGHKVQSRIDSDNVIAVFSPDGKTFLTGSYDKTARLWSLDGKLIRTFEGHSGNINAIAFAPNGETVLTGSADKTAKLWSLDGTVITTFEGHQKSVSSVVYAPHGKSITTGSTDKTIIIWSLNGDIQTTFTDHKSKVEAITFSPDGQSLASVSDSVCNVWTPDGEVLTTFQDKDNQLTSVAFSPDGKMLLIGGFNKSAVKLWTLDGHLITTFMGHQRSISSVAFSSDGKTILTGSYDSTVKIWSLDGQVQSTFGVSNGPISSVAFSPDGKTVLTGSSDKTVKIWSIEGKKITTFADSPKGIRCLAFSPNSKMILTADREENIAKLRALDNQLITTLEGHKAIITSVAFSANGEKILTGSADNTSKLWSINGQLLTTFDENVSRIICVAFVLDNERVVTEKAGETVQLWSFDGKIIATLEKQKGYIVDVAFSPDGKLMCTDSNVGTITLWSSDGKLLHVFENNQGWVHKIAFSPDSKTILVASADDNAVLYSLEGQIITTFIGHESMIMSVAFSPDGQTIMTGCEDATVKLWSLDGKVIITLTEHKQSVSDSIFSPDGTMILTNSRDKTAKLLMSPQHFLDKQIYKFSLKELYKIGVQLEPHDLLKLWEQGVMLTPHELELIEKFENKESTYSV